MLDNEKLLVLEDNNKYAIVDQFMEGETHYIYLVDINNNANILYGKIENGDVVVLNDADELEKVIKLVNEHLHKKGTN